MNPNQDFLKNIKIGDKVILESNNYALKTRVMSICTIDRITSVKKDIVLNNNYKFTQYGQCKDNNWCNYSRMLEYTEENIKEYELCNMQQKLKCTLRNDINLIDKMSLEECIIIFDILKKYKEE